MKRYIKSSTNGSFDVGGRYGENTANTWKRFLDHCGLNKYIAEYIGDDVTVQANSYIGYVHNEYDSDDLSYIREVAVNVSYYTAGSWIQRRFKLYVNVFKNYDSTRASDDIISIADPHHLFRPSYQSNEFAHGVEYSQVKRDIIDDTTNLEEYFDTAKISYYLRETLIEMKDKIDASLAKKAKEGSKRRKQRGKNAKMKGELSYTPRYGARNGEDEITEDEIEFLMEKYGGKPVKKYFIANPAFYGDGFYSYGADYATNFYELDNGKYVEWSSYTGDKEYKDAAEMQAAMEAIEDEFDADEAEYEAEYGDAD